MCSCFYLRLSKQLLGGLGARFADEVSDMIVRIKRGLSRCCYSQPPEPPGTETIATSFARLDTDPRDRRSVSNPDRTFAAAFLPKLETKRRLNEPRKRTCAGRCIFKPRGDCVAPCRGTNGWPCFIAYSTRSRVKCQSVR